MLLNITSFLHNIPFATIWRLAWPQTVTMMCTMIIGMTDVWVAGKIDSGTQAAVGFSAQIQAFLLVLAMGLSAGAMAAVSQSTGAGKKGRVQSYVGLVMVIALIFALFLCGLMYLGDRHVLHLLQVPAEVEDLTLYFYYFLILGLPAQYIMNVGSTLFRASQNVLMPLLAVVVACSINGIGDLVFGLGLFGVPAYGAQGLAWATFLSVCAGAVILLWLMRRCHLLLPRVLPPLRWMKQASPYLLKVSLPAMLMQFLWQSGYLSLFVIMAALPDSVDELAGLTAGIRIESVLYMPGIAFNATAAIMVGSLLGAGKVTEARHTGLAITVLGAAVMSSIGAVMWLFIDPISAAFSYDPVVRQEITTYLIYNILSTPFTVGGMIVSGVMTGAGATLYTMIVNTSCIWLIRLPLAWLLAHRLAWGSEGVYAAMLSSMIIQASTMGLIFFRANWPRHAMRGSRS